MSERSPLGGLRAAVSFLTPVGGATTPGPQALPWFPVVGAGVGLSVGAVWWLAGHIWPTAVAAALAVVADLALTGMLHLDGLCDAADGLLGHLSVERRLEVMSSPEVGAFGVTAAATTLLCRWVLLAALRPAPLLVGGLWAASRTWMAAAAVGLPYARPGGLAQAFRPRPDGRTGQLAVVGLTGGAGALLLAGIWRPAVGPASVVGGTLAATGVIVLAWRRLGGFTGDVLGAAGVVGETVGLLVAAAKW